MQIYPLISGTSRDVATFQLTLQFVRYRLHIWQLGRSNGVVAPAVTLDDLDLFF